MREIIADKFKVRNYSMGDKFKKSLSNYSLINLGIGDLDIHTDKKIVEKAMNDALNGYTHYTDPYGYVELREEIVNYHKSRFKNYNFSIEDTFITTGACHALYLAFKAILNKDDEVILLAPYFPIYADQIKLSDGIPVIVETKLENEFQLIKEDIEKVITDKTKAIVINTPSNPTGVCYNEKSLNIIKELAEKYDLLVIADDVYDFYSYENSFTPIFTLEGMDKRTLSICSFSKDFAMTGWRIGYTISKVPNLIETMEYINESIIYSAPSVSQRAALYALKDFDRIKKEVVPIFKERIEYSYNRIKNIPYLKAFKSQGGIYLFVNIEKTKLSTQEFVDLVFDKLNIILLSGESFGAPNYIRIACTLDISILKEAFDRLETLKF
ncbi:aminotransferase class I/II-fold pyridoxal phosphate-dependent enzyme [uncultured Fusobacterium sp.]|uniref:aminotransferase class I/II-fold pyridoxal phosphate-dependent enzyme n=1 Tax=uncultured Fusobacterium sp. TaxID=159267 RepID=UPI0026114FF5|nr:aminotransferase class I/II-fold pyridoxal phosphate-dependent enzyme [uncultured Fusobacterium sp.]